MTVLIRSGETSTRVHLAEERLDLAHGEPARIQRDDLVVEAGEASLVFADQARLERAGAIARDLERQRPVVGQHRLPARAIAMIGRVLGLRPARRIAQMVRQLAAQRPLDDRLLEPADRRVELLGRERPLARRIDRESRRESAPAALQTWTFSVCGA